MGERGGLADRSSADHGAVLARQATAAVVAIAALGIALLCLAWAGRWVLDRRRLADDRTRHHRSAQAYQAADYGNRPAGGFGSDHHPPIHPGYLT